MTAPLTSKRQLFWWSDWKVFRKRVLGRLGCLIRGHSWESTYRWDHDAIGTDKEFVKDDTITNCEACWSTRIVPIPMGPPR